MTFSSQSSTATPSWIDCFATDDGRIIVVGGSFQVLVYNIGSSTWDDTNTPSSSLQYGKYVQANMFLNPVYIQSRILADGHTALVVCTLTWNSQPQPYYLDTNTWMVTLAIGTSDTTPPISSSSSSGWGVVPGGGPLLPPAGFRHYTLAILGQDKNQPNNHYGNGQAYIIGGYSSLVTGQVSDWSAITSFPVQQAPSKNIVMFGNVASLTQVTRGSAAYAISGSNLDIFPGNGGGSSTQQNIEVYNSNQNVVNMLSGISGGPKNTIFRGATVIGQGQQIFLHGGLLSLNGPSTLSVDNLDQSVGVWNGGSQEWGDTVNIFVEKKSKTLMIGLIAGGVVLVALVGVGVWYLRKRHKMRQLEEEELKAKGLVLKNEDKLQKEHRTSRQNNNSNGNNDSDAGSPLVAQSIPVVPLYHNQLGTVGAEVGAYELPHQQNYNYAEVPRNSSIDIRRQNAFQGHTEYSYAEAELIDEETAMNFPIQPRIVNSPQEYPTKGTTYNDISRAPSHYQPVVSVPGHPVYGMPSYDASKHTGFKASQTAEDLRNFENLRASQEADPRISLDPLSMQNNQSLASSADMGSLLYTQTGSIASHPSAVTAQDSFNNVRPYSNMSSTSFLPQGTNQLGSYMSSPTFSATFSVPESTQGSEGAPHSITRSNPSEQNVAYPYPLQTKASDNFNTPSQNVAGPAPHSPPVVPYQSRPV
ncbi:hypothetical protein BGZ49_006921 [Haplosporangium sp. Z 27]|nr:hypothetical protein BGZ49_006921 [Haplosporangium sp. Z 27]